MRKACLCLLTLLFGTMLVWAAGASGGTSADPVVSQSYVDGTFRENAIENARARISSAFGNFVAKYIVQAERLSDSAENKLSAGEIVDATADAVLEHLQAQGKYLYSTSSMTPITLEKDDVIYGRAGTSVIVFEGSAVSYGGAVIDITGGRELPKNYALGKFTRFMFPDSASGIRITSATAKVTVDGVYSKLSCAYKPKYYAEADELRALGLVRGAAKGLELARGNTRAESVTMLIRLLGEENAALSAQQAHPFTDVDTWAQRYVGYAYKKGYTNGVSATRYDGSSATTANHYMTFLLRSLGYDDTKGDFKWDTAMQDAVRLGVISEKERAEVMSGPFYRDQVMLLSHRALSAKLKNSDMTLLAKLVLDGAVSGEAANEFLQK